MTFSPSHRLAFPTSSRWIVGKKVSRSYHRLYCTAGSLAPFTRQPCFFFSSLLESVISSFPSPRLFSPDTRQMDPLSVVGLIESSLGLALQFGSAAKTLNDIAGKYKNVKLATKFLAQNLDILQLTWSQICQWFEAHVDDGSLRDNDLVKRVRSFLETGTLVMEALVQDLLEYDVDNLNFAQRSKLIWNENTLQGHQVRIRDQILSMSLFLQAVKL